MHTLPKKYYLYLCIGLALLGNGCLPHQSQYTPPTNTQAFSTSTQPSLVSWHPTTTPHTSPTLSSEEQSTLVTWYTTNYFNKKIIPLDILSMFGTSTNIDYRPDVNTYDQKDCLGIVGGKTLGGDLLTTFVNDGRFKEAVERAYTNNHGITSSPFIYYTTSYLKKLKETANKFIQKKYHQDLYAYYICHFGDSIDVVAGSVWDSKVSPYYFNTNIQGVDTQEAFASSTTVLVVTKNSVREFNALQTVNRTGTGAEVYPCQATLKNNEIMWTCFSRIVSCSEHVKTQEFYTWILRLNGTHSRKITSLKPSCQEAEKISKMNQ